MLIVAKILVTLAAVAAAILLAAYFGQRRLLYFPDRTRTQPADVGLLSVTEHILTAPDGAQIVTWWAKAKPGQPTLLYFHGNGGALAARQPRFERFMGEGWGVYMMSYRSYSGSTGRPTEADNIADAVLAFDWIATQGVTKIILYGESLGTGVATQVATQRPAIGLILDAPYTSTWEVGETRFPFLPVRRAMWDRYETRRHILNVRVPILILHGKLDAVIPVAMGREVAQIAPEPKTYVEFPRGGHIDLYINGNHALTHVRAFIADLKQ